MTEDSLSNNHLPDPELERLRQEWVDAHGAWTQVVGNAHATGSNLTDEQRAALGRHRAAETAYFSHPRMQIPAS